jgi:hypothetical protein
MGVFRFIYKTNFVLSNTSKNLNKLDTFPFNATAFH